MADTKVASKVSFKPAISIALASVGVLVALLFALSWFNSAQAVDPGPKGASMTMYDYTVDTTQADQSVSAPADLWADLTKGINSADGTAPGHLLKFRKANDNPLAVPAGETSELLEKYATSNLNLGGNTRDMPDATEPVLNASGYPVLHDLSIPASESLDYLFDGSTQNGKAVYPANASTLLQQSGTQWSYDSNTKSALFDTATGNFTLGAAPASYFDRGFFPFGGGPNDGNHYFGMQFIQPFVMTESGKDLSGNPMTFSFSGDDDVFFSIDGVVVSSLAGGLRSKSVSIDMTTGKVTRTNAANAVTQTTLGKLFQDAGVTGKTTGDLLTAGDHTFKMWYLEQGNFGSSLLMSYNLVPRVASLNYDMNGGDGSIDSVEVAENSTATVTSEVPTRTGYSFEGWNSTKTGSGTTYTAAQVVTLNEDLTLYAQWKQIAHTLTYDANGGTGSVAAQVGNGDVTLADFTGMSRDGYTVVAWLSQKDTGDAYKPGDSFDLTQDTTLYAYWVKDLDFVWQANGGAGDGGETSVQTSVAITSERTATPKSSTGWAWVLVYKYQGIDNPFSRDGYQFRSWNTKADGSGRDVPELLSVRSSAPQLTVEQLTPSPVDMYAQWDPLVTYDPNGGSGENVTETAGGSHQFDVEDQGYDRDGYIFAGYNDKADGTGKSYAVKDTIDVLSPLHLYAQWKKAVAVLPSTGSSDTKNAILLGLGTIGIGIIVAGVTTVGTRRRNVR
ncbi:MAG: InlB B-repeat-containing protein [Bifidobacteriaceae bacterium]|nr:InlB B-repeat-containing protein [Bifidobacteriaceae bacterium]MCI1915335.1 InlB B-repeat-containing protein [Bifidobacteriaceae bacterium]